MTNETFGQKLKRMRLNHGLSLNKAAREAGISAPYLGDMEHGRKSAPARDKLMTLVRALGLNKAEEAELCDAAGKAQNTIAYDLPDYIMDRDYVTVALRTAKDLDAGEEIWKKFVDELLASEGQKHEPSGDH
ncbi:helix-turn-helix domain-containing protein [Ileibacterium valens]|uniref:helix-turn-helix domain-containing protein n=1 Tax=Ileibacterium valens TaxID=1862668 RepID=UPI00235323DC|nr:helix-turn-helix transcriptional regulator [Ileibacterium valens]